MECFDRHTFIVHWFIKQALKLEWSAYEELNTFPVVYDDILDKDLKVALFQTM